MLGTSLSLWSGAPRIIGPTLGPELRSTVVTGVNQTTGTTTGSASYDTSTGNGTVTRAVSTDQNWVRISGLDPAGTYRVALASVTGTIAMAIRTGTATGTIIETVALGSGSTTRDYVMNAATALAFNASAAGSSTFTGLSIRKVG